ncbi:MAG TPA: hypothetical protein VN764_02870, partial [Polyangiaceae bacterium]|nr:hypothetical protein [Polyangiaceae bacterium]
MFHRSSKLDRLAASSALLPTSFVTEQGDAPTLTLEVIVRWGHSVLRVAHVDPERGFSLGQPQLRGEQVDFPVSPQLLGCQQLQLLTLDASAGYCAVLPRQSSACLLRDGARLTGDSLHALTRSGAPGGVLLPMTRGDRLHLQLPGLELDLSLVAQSTPLPHSLLDAIDKEIPLYFGASAATFLSLLGALAFFAPPLGLVDENQLDQERLLMISQYLDAASEREQEQTAQPVASSGSDGGAAGKQAPGDEGAAGKVDGPRAQKQAAVRGPRDNPELKLNRQQLLSEAREAGMIGLLHADLGASFNHPVFGRDQTLGNADLTAQGAMWGDELGESSGVGGLGLSGIGFGGG